MKLSAGVMMALHPENMSKTMVAIRDEKRMASLTPEQQEDIKKLLELHHKMAMIQPRELALYFEISPPPNLNDPYIAMIWEDYLELKKAHPDITFERVKAEVDAHG